MGIKRAGGAVARHGSGTVDGDAGPMLAPGSGTEATMSTDEQATAPAELLNEQFLRDFASRWHAAWNAYDPQQVAAPKQQVRTPRGVRRWPAGVSR
jgi:hypothetical protein